MLGKLALRRVELLSLGQYLPLLRGGKKSLNPLAHLNPLTNCPTKPTYLINGQMDAIPITPN